MTNKLSNCFVIKLQLDCLKYKRDREVILHLVWHVIILSNYTIILLLNQDTVYLNNDVVCLNHI